MKIVLSRIDERLVHGQVIASWTRKLEIKKILIIDNDMAEDDFMKEVLRMSAPSNVTVDVVDCEKAVNYIIEDTDNLNTMLLFKSVEGVYDLLQHGYKLEKLDVGNIGSGPGRTAITKRVFMSKDEVNKIKAICNAGTYVYFQMLQSDPEVDAHKLIK